MGTPHREHAPAEEIQGVEARLKSKEDRVQWAVDFAQTNLVSLSPGRLHDLQTELAAIIGTPAKAGQCDLFSAQELQDVQAHFVGYLRELAGKGKGKVGRINANVWVEWQGDTYGLRFDWPLPKPASPERAAFHLAMLLGHAKNKVRECQAPKAWGEEGESCSRLFIGRPNQVYCSALCQNRAGTQRVRMLAPPRPIPLPPTRRGSS